MDTREDKKLEPASPGASRDGAQESPRHTRTPWRAYQGPQSSKWLIAQGHGMGYIIASLLRESTEEIQQANAEFITRAVNCHDDLVAALQAAADFCRDLQAGTACPDGHARIIEDRLRAALAKAEGR